MNSIKTFFRKLILFIIPVINLLMFFGASFGCAFPSSAPDYECVILRPLLLVTTISLFVLASKIESRISKSLNVGNLVIVYIILVVIASTALFILS
jgi:hypothetical protein